MLVDGRGRHRPIKYSYECCVCINISRDSCITYHVTSIVFLIVFKTVNIIWCLKRHCDVMISASKSMALPKVVAFFRNLFFKLFIEYDFHGVSAADLRLNCSIKTKLLDAEFEYLVTFSIWVELILLNENKNNLSPKEHDKYGRLILFYNLPLNIWPFHPRGIKIK